MTDKQDIVIRLRKHIAITTQLHYTKDSYPKPMYIHGPSQICQEAADEIERLRNELEESEKLLDEYQREAADRTRWENTND